MYSRWRKIRDLDKDDPLENKGQMQSSFKEFEKKIRWRWYLLPYRRIRINSLLTKALDESTNTFMQILENVGLYWTNKFYKISFWLHYCPHGTIQDDYLTERVDLDLNIREHSRTYLNRFFISQIKSPPTRK